MIYILIDDGEVVGSIANLTQGQIEEATRKVDQAFRRWLDQVPAEGDLLERRMCEDLGIPFDNAITDWQDVLLTYLEQMGATFVEHRLIPAVPKRESV